MDPIPTPGEEDFTLFRPGPAVRLRKEARYKCPLTTMAQVAEVGYPEVQEQTVWLANISRHGLAFYSAKSFLPGEKIVLWIKELASLRPELQVQVMHTTKQLNGDWLVGGRMDSPLSAEELGRCLEDPE